MSQDYRRSPVLASHKVQTAGLTPLWTPLWAAGSAAMTGPLDPGVSEQELDSARRLGERIAGLVKKLKAR
jgi:hypothetical protein